MEDIKEIQTGHITTILDSVDSRKSAPYLLDIDAKFKEDFSLAFKKKLNPEEYFWLQKWWSTIGDFTDFQSPKGYCLIDKGSERKLVMPGNYLLQGIRADKYQKGTQRVDILFPKLYEDKFDGKDSFFWIHGKTHTNDFNDLPQILRFYFNLKTDSDAIINLREDIQTVFDDWGVPFSFKYLSKYDSFCRADSGVLYVSQKYFEIALWLVAQIYHENKNSLIDSTPLFTYQIAPGLGFAEDPERNDGKSFGDTRSLQLAEAIYDNTNEDLEIDKDKLIESLHDYGIILGRTHLNENSRYYYNFNEFGEYLKIIPNYINHIKHIVTIYSDFRDAAYNIAQQICKEAIWSEDGTCTWISVKNVKGKPPQYGFINHSLNHGNAGIALSLALINSVRSDYFLEKTIHGALCKIIRDKKLTNRIDEAFVQSWLSDYQDNGFEIINGIGKVFEKVGVILKNENYLGISKDVNTALESLYNGELPIPFKIGGDVLDANLKDFKLMAQNNPTAGLTPRVKYYKEVVKLAKDIIEGFYKQDRLYINNIDGSERFCPTMNDGLAGVGYFFAKTYNYTYRDLTDDLLPPLEFPKLQKFLSAIEARF
jgi:HopA1 effector protein family